MSKVKSVCVPISPDSCGSVVSGYVKFPKWRRSRHGKKHWTFDTSAEVSLSDCSRVIRWDMGRGLYDYDVRKIDKAIAALQEIRKQMIAAQKESRKMHAEMKRRNRALDANWKEHPDLELDL